MTRETAQVVAILNSSEDIIEAIELLLEDAGYSTVGSHVYDFKKGYKDIAAFLNAHNPRVILFDISPPYEENWQFFLKVKHMEAAARRHFILLTTNLRVLEDLIGTTHAIELVGKPFDLQEILRAVKKGFNEDYP
jgi:response regulator RpfG family c-di-GMP phosphodiesterase